VAFDIHLDHRLEALEWDDMIVLPNGGRPSPLVDDHQVGRRSVTPPELWLL
jgi:hypothetical protein